MSIVKLSLFGLITVASSSTNCFDDLVQCFQTVFPGSPGSLLDSAFASVREAPALSFYLSFRKFNVPF